MASLHPNLDVRAHSEAQLIIEFAGSRGSLNTRTQITGPPPLTGTPMALDSAKGVQLIQLSNAAVGEMRYPPGSPTLPRPLPSWNDARQHSNCPRWTAIGEFVQRRNSLKKRCICSNQPCGWKDWRLASVSRRAKVSHCLFGPPLGATLHSRHDQSASGLDALQAYEEAQRSAAAAAKDVCESFGQVGY